MSNQAISHSGNRAMGRPTKYGQEIIDTSLDYLANYKDSYNDVIPTINGLAVALDISRQTIYDWSRQEDKQEFSYLVSRLANTQCHVLINNGLNGTFNPTITKLLLSKHGYYDRPKQDSGTPVNIILDRTCGGSVVFDDDNEPECDDTLAIEES